MRQKIKTEIVRKNIKSQYGIRCPGFLCYGDYRLARGGVFINAAEYRNTGVLLGYFEPVAFPRGKIGHLFLQLAGHIDDLSIQNDVGHNYIVPQYSLKPLKIDSHPLDRILQPPLLQTFVHRCGAEGQKCLVHSEIASFLGRIVPGQSHARDFGIPKKRIAKKAYPARSQREYDQKHEDVEGRSAQNRPEPHRSPSQPLKLFWIA
ncbi:hypothetical protein [Bilophila sp.]|uniref:hypothetical protein n=1 Tax=Bilophila sp. TaxID=1929485 RepID=UPI003076891C